MQDDPPACTRKTKKRLNAQEKKKLYSEENFYTPAKQSVIYSKQSTTAHSAGHMNKERHHERTQTN